MTAAQVTANTSRSEAARSGKLVAIVLAFTTVVALVVLAFGPTAPTLLNLGLRLHPSGSDLESSPSCTAVTTGRSRTG